MSEYSAVSFKIEADNKPALSAISEVRSALNDLKVNFKFKIPKSTIKSAMKAMTEEITSEAKKMAEEMESATNSSFGATSTISESATKVWDEARLALLRFEGAAQQVEGNIMAMKMEPSRIPFQEATSHVEEFRDAMYSLGDAINEYDLLNGSYRISDIEWKDAFHVPDAYVMDLDTSNSRLSTMETTLEGIANDWDTIEIASAGFGEEMVDFSKIAEEAWGRFKEGAKSALGYAISTVKSFASTLTGVLKSGFDKLTESVRNSTKGFDNLFNSIKRIAMYRALRTAIKEITSSVKEGLENLYRWSRLNDGEFSGSMDKLATEALHVKNALGAMLAPVINAVTPLVEKLAHAFINVVNAINQFISGITGATSWTKALHTPVTYAQMAGSSFDKANKKAKELKNTILGFDEINRLNGKTDTSSTDSELPYGSMFEKVPLGNFWKDWLDKLDWTDLGRLFAQKANKLLAQIDNWILNVARPWAMKWSTRIATFLNGFVDEFDWELLGKTVADGLMTIVYAVNNFFDRFFAQRLGKGLARSVKSWFETIDWPAIGRFFANGINFVADTAAGFFREFVKDAETYGEGLGIAFKSWVDSIKWGTIREALGNGLDSISKMIQGFVKGDDGSWDKFRDEFVKTINTVLGSPGLTDFLTAAAGIVNDLVSALGEVDWYSVGYNIGHFLGTIDWVNALQVAASALWDGFIGALKGVIDSGGAGNMALAAAIVAGIGGVISLAGSALSGMLAHMGSTLLEGIATWVAGTAMPAIGAFFTAGAGPVLLAVGGIVADVVGIFHLADLGMQIAEANSELAAAKANENAAAVQLQAALAAQGVNASLEEINAHLNGAMSLAELTGGKFGAMSQEVSGEVSGMAKTTGDAFSKLSDNTFDFTKDVNGAVTKFLTEASDGSTESMKQLSDDTVKIFSEISDAVAKINTALSTSFSKMASSISDSMQRMYNSVSTNMTRIAKNVEDNARRIQNAFSSISGSNMTIKGYATGGFPEDGLFMANHNELVGGFANGKTAVANNAEITAGIEAAVYSAMTSAMGNSSGGGDIVIRIDSEEIARASIKGQRRIDRRMNPTVKFTG